tara:strand:+ start:3178 stop:5256 length:2079 start_codon:yes stop_codon:yes gene_type:complete
MQVVELYISNTRVDLFKDESLTITDTIINAKDVAKVFTAFSQQFSLPASSTNNQIFKHYYNYEITGGFDARVRVNAILKLNGVDYKIGKVKLNSVMMKDNKAYAYKVVFYGQTIELNDILGEDKLANLDSLDPENIVYNAANIKAKLQLDPNVAGNNLITPLITHTKRLFYDSVSHTGTDSRGTGNLYYHGGTVDYHGVLYSDLKYAIRIHRLILAIQTQYPSIVFSTDFFNTSNAAYHGLYMWLHRKAGAVGNGTQVETFPNSVTGWNPISEDWSSMSSASTLTVNPVFQDYINSDTNLRLTVLTTSAESYELEVFKDGQSISVGNYTGNKTLVTTQTGGDFGSPLFAAGEYTVVISVTQSASVTFSSVVWNVVNNDGDETLTDTYSISGGFTADDSFEFIVKLQTPDIKIIDFLTALFKMFNLIAYVKEDGSIYVDTLDSFYATSTSYDITKYIDVKTSSVNVALPYREIKFKYDGLKTFLAAQYEQLQVQEWGTEYYSTSTNLDGGIYEVKIPFEHMLFERLANVSDVSGDTLTTAQYGYSVNDSQQAYIGKPLIFYPILKSGAGTTSISFLNTTTERVQLTSYIVPSNSLSLTAATSTANINFGNMPNEFTGLTNFTGTLYNNYYNNYISNLFLQSSRVIQVTAFLPLSIILNYTLADILIISGKQYRINSLNINLINNKTKIELITI